MAIGGHYQWGRKDGFPGADGSTITQVNPNATTITIYGTDGNILTEGSTGIRLVNNATLGSPINSKIYAIKNPLSFIYNTVVPNDWYTNPDNQNSILWGDGTNKSDFDPCPQNWRTPAEAANTWGDYSIYTALYYLYGHSNISGGYDITSGRLYNHITWYPATGYRYYASGELTDVSYYGACWSTLTATLYSVNFLFNFNTINPWSYNARAQGFPVRCIQE